VARIQPTVPQEESGVDSTATRENTETERRVDDSEAVAISEAMDPGVSGIEHPGLSPVSDPEQEQEGIEQEGTSLRQEEDVYDQEAGDACGKSGEEHEEGSDSRSHEKEQQQMPPPCHNLPFMPFAGQLTDFQRWEYDRLVSVSVNVIRTSEQVAALREEHERMIHNQARHGYCQSLFSQVQTELVAQGRAPQEAYERSEARARDLQHEVEEMRPQVTEAREQPQQLPTGVPPTRVGR
jgi:cell fate (sporulation/competence/biofilm development) regulator YmcA (YheA/YmcA/DUF963 family)